MFGTRGFALAAWQREAANAWAKGDRAGPYRGTLEVFTGGGKTLIALACAEEASRSAPNLRLAIVVPTEALARQWQAVLERFTNLDAAEIGLLGAGGSATFANHRAVVAVLNTAAKRLPELSRSAQPLMLIVDECHRAGAPTFAQVLRTHAGFRLGLSATPDREELDDYGEPLAYDEQLVGQALGSVVYRFDLRDARLHGWLPDYEIHHHGLQLTPEERREYDSLSRRVDDLADHLRKLGFDASRAQHLQTRPDEVGQAARSYVGVTSQRKDLLYRARERSRVAQRLLADALAAREPRRVLLFHERVDEAVDLYSELIAALPQARVVLEHSRLPTGERVAAMGAFRSGAAQVLVSVKSLVEGIDVPEADIGVSVASTSSVRQRIQSLGRVLRRQFDPAGPAKHAEMHLLYVAETVDEVIYTKQDWSDLTGHGANHYWRWPIEADRPPEQADGPPASPRPTEEQEWERLGHRPPAQPLPWLGVIMGQEYSVDTLGTVTNSFGATITNPQNVAAMVEVVRGRPGGRFRVTPAHRLVLVWGEGTEGPQPFVAGQLAEPFQAAADDDGVGGDGAFDPSSLDPGSRYAAPANKEGGTYKLRQKQGGVIERRAPDGALEFALLDGTARPQLEANARRVLDAWRELFDRGITFHVNGHGHAWYTEAGQRRFLATVPGGFAWPSLTEEEIS
jgi:superfamily II DNA or RNA helicase